jgi:hypothetical protein
MVEYRASLNLSNSITRVKIRHQEIEAQRARMEAMPSAPPVQPTPEAVPHIVVQTPADESVTMTLRVVGNQRQIDLLIQFLDDHWYTYEEVK